VDGGAPACHGPSVALRLLRILLACAALAAGLAAVSSAMAGGEAEQTAPVATTPSISTMIGCDARALAPGSLTADHFREFCAQSR
jgi:hypothetical protein